MLLLACCCCYTLYFGKCTCTCSLEHCSALAQLLCSFIFDTLIERSENPTNKLFLFFIGKTIVEKDYIAMAGNHVWHTTWIFRNLVDKNKQPPFRPCEYLATSLWITLFALANQMKVVVLPPYGDCYFCETIETEFKFWETWLMKAEPIWLFLHFGPVK